MLPNMDNYNLHRHWKTKVLQRNGLSPKRMELEQHEDQDIQLNRSEYFELFAFKCVVRIYGTRILNIIEDENNHKYYGNNLH